MAQEDPPKGIDMGNSSLDPTVIQKQKEYYSNPQYNEDGTIKMSGYEVDPFKTQMLNADKGFNAFEEMTKWSNYKLDVKWDMPYSNDEYKAMFPQYNLTDEQINSFRDNFNAVNDLLKNKMLKQTNASPSEIGSLFFLEDFYGYTEVHKSTGSLGQVPKYIEALSNYEYIDLNGNYQYGRAKQTINGETVPSLTEIVWDQKRQMYLFKEVGEGKRQTQNINQFYSQGNINYIPSHVFNKIIENGGSYFSYTDKQGNNITLKDVGYDAEGNLITNNGLVAGNSSLTERDIANGNLIISQLQNAGIDLGNNIYKKNRVAKDGEIVKFNSIKSPSLYQEAYSFTDYFGHSFVNSFVNTGLWIGDMFANSKALDNLYYKQQIKEYQSPEGFDTSSIWYSRNIAKQTGDLAAQIVPTIVVSAATGGLGAAGMGSILLKAAGKATLKKGGLFLGKEGIKVAEMSLGKRVINKVLLPSARELSWAGMAAGQQGYSTWQEGIQSGIPESDAMKISIGTAAVTLMTSKLLEPTYLRKGYMMMADKSIIGKKVVETAKELGGDLFSVEGKNVFIKNTVDKVMKSVNSGGVGGFLTSVVVNAGMEGVQEYSDFLQEGAWKEFYNNNWAAAGTSEGYGKYNTDEHWKHGWDSFIMGALMGAGANVVNPISVISAFNNNKKNEKDANDYTLYNEMRQYGVEKTVRTAINKAKSIHSENKMGDTNLDAEGNPFVLDEEGNRTGATREVTDESFKGYFPDGKLKNMNDVNFYNFLIELAKEADIYNAMLADPNFKKIDSDVLIGADKKNNIAINAAKAMKGLTTKKQEIALKKELLEAEKDAEKKKLIEADIKQLESNDVEDENTLAYAQKQYDYWTKPMNEEVVEGEKITNYGYSKGIKDSILKSLFIREHASLVEVLRSGKNVEVNDNDTKTMLHALLMSPENVFHYTSQYHDLLGSIAPVGKNMKGDKVYIGFGKIVNEWNNKQKQEHLTKERLTAIKTSLKAIIDGGKVKNKSSLATMNAKIQEVNKMISDVDKLIGDRTKFAEGVAYISDERANDIDDIIDFIGTIRNELDNDNILEGDRLRELNAKESLTEDEQVESEILNEMIEENTTELSEYSSWKEELSGSLDKMLDDINTSKKNADLRKVDLELLENMDNIDPNDKELVQKIAALLEEAIKGDMPISLFLPKELRDRLDPRARGMSMKQFLQYAEEIMEGEADENSLSVVSAGMEAMEIFINGMKSYMWGLEIQYNDTSDLIEAHNNLNTVLLEILNKKEQLSEYFTALYDRVTVINTELAKRGFTREKENLRYMAATICNTDTYLTTLGITNYTDIILHIIEIKNGKYIIPDENKLLNNKDKAFVINLKKYISDKKMTDAEAQEFLAKAVGGDMVFINTETRQYKAAVRDIMVKYFGELAQPEDKSFEDIYEASSIIKALEGAYDSGDANMVNKVQAAMNEIYALQWQVRSKFSGMLTVPMIYNEALAKENNITYDKITLNGKKLYKDENSSENDISTIYRGIYSPSEMFMGKTYLFTNSSELTNMDRKHLVLMAEKIEIAPAEINSMSDDDLRDAIRNNIYQDPNAVARSRNTMHLLMSSMSIDNYLGGENINVADIFKSIQKNKEQNIYKIADFSTEEKDIISKAIVYKDGRIDEEKTIANLVEIIKTKKGKIKQYSESIFSAIRKNINIEQENVIIQMVANYYRIQAGEYELGQAYNDKGTSKPLPNSMCVLGSGGVGKSTMIMENYVNILVAINKKGIKNEENVLVPNDKPLRFLVLAPNEEVGNMQLNSLKQQFPGGEMKGNTYNSKDVSVTVKMFQDLNTINETYDILIADEVSLINASQIEGGQREVFFNKIIAAKAKQNILIFDNNQTLNIREGNPDIIERLGEKTMPLQMRYRTGYLDINRLASIFSNDQFLTWDSNVSLMPTLSVNNTSMKSQYKEMRIGEMSVLSGVKITSEESEVIEDYRKVKKYAPNNTMIVVLNNNEKNRIANAYGIDKNDIYILDPEDTKYNVSGKGMENVFVIIDPKEILSQQLNRGKEPIPLFYSRMAKYYYTAVTRLKGDGFLSLMYPEGESYSKEAPIDSIIPKYNDTLNYDNIVGEDIDGITSIFSKQIAIELKESNRINDRYNAIYSVFGEETDNEDTDNEDTDNEITGEGINNLSEEEELAARKKNVTEDILKNKEVKKKVKELRAAEEEGTDISDVIYEGVEKKENYQYTMQFNKLLRRILEFTFKSFQDGLVNNEVLSNTNNPFYDRVIKEYEKFTEHTEFNLAEYRKAHGEENFKKFFQNVILKTFNISNVELLGTLMNSGTAIIAPYLNATMISSDNDKRNDKRITTQPLIVNVVGYTDTNVPIVDVYMIDLFDLERTKDSLLKSKTMDKIQYTVAMLAKQGYQVNVVSVMSYKKQLIEKNDKNKFLVSYTGTIDLTPTDVIGDGKAYGIKLGQLGLSEEKVFSEPDALLKLGVIESITKEERTNRYQNISTGKSAFIKAKTRVKTGDGEVVYYQMSDKTTVAETDFASKYNILTVPKKNKKDKGSIEDGTITSFMRGIPVSDIEQAPTTKEEFYHGDYFNDLRKRISAIKPNDVLDVEYVEGKQMYIFNENTNKVEKVVYSHVILLKKNGKVVGLQERITYGDNTYNNVEVNKLISLYIKEKDNAKSSEYITKISNIIADTYENNEYKERNVAYQIAKIQRIRDVNNGMNTVTVSSKTPGSVILNKKEKISISQLLTNIDSKNNKLKWGYDNDAEGFGLYATISQNDGSPVVVYVNANKVDSDYIKSMRDIIADIEKRYHAILYGKKEINKKDISKLYEELKNSEVYDFLYANRNKIEEIFFNNQYIELNKRTGIEGKALLSDVIAKIKYTINLAESNLNADMTKSYNKAIFKSDRNSGDISVYEDNLYTNVTDISTQGINTIGSIPVENISTEQAEQAEQPKQIETNEAIDNTYHEDDDDFDKTADYTYASQMAAGISNEEASMIIHSILGDNLAANGLQFKEGLRNERTNALVYGKMKNHIITLATLDGKVHSTVAKHEAMHFILSYMLSPEEYARVIKAATEKLMSKAYYKNNNKIPTERDAVEYIAEQYEGYKVKDVSPNANILQRILNALKSIVNAFKTNIDVLDSLFYKAETGFYSKSHMAIYNNNTTLNPDYKSVDKEYGDADSIDSFFDLFGSKYENVIKAIEEEKARILNHSIFGKIVTAYPNVSSILAYRYDMMTDPDMLKKMGDVVITLNNKKAEKFTIREYFSNNKNSYETFINKINNNRSSVMLNTNQVLGVVKDVTLGEYNNPTKAIKLLAMMYVMANNITENSNPVAVYLKALQPDINIDSVINRVEEIREMRKDDKATVRDKFACYQNSYGKKGEFNNWVHYTFQSLIQNIKYYKNKNSDLVSYVKWEEFATTMMNITRTFMLGNVHADKKELSYSEIIAMISNLKGNEETVKIYDAIVKALGNYGPSYDMNNYESIKAMVTKEYDAISGNMNMLNQGYDYLLDKINNYLTKGNPFNDALYEIAGNNYNEIITRLKIKRENIIALKNYMVNIFHSQANLDMVVITNNYRIAKINDNTKVQISNLQTEADNIQFEKDDEGDIIGITDTMEKLINDTIVEKDGDITTLKYRNKKEIEINLNELNEYTKEQTEIIKDILNIMYGEIVDDDMLISSYDENSKKNIIKTKYLKLLLTNLRKIRNNKAKFIEEGNAESFNVVEFTNDIKDNLYLSALKSMRNAEGNHITPVTVTTPFLKYFSMGTKKLHAYLNSIETIFKVNGEYLNPIVSGMIELQDVQLLGGMTYNENGKDWGNLIMKDRIELFYNHLLTEYSQRNKTDDISKMYRLLISHTGDRESTYSATMNNNPFFDVIEIENVVTHKKESKISINKEMIGEAVKMISMFYEFKYKQHEQRMKDADVEVSDEGILTVKKQAVEYHSNPFEKTDIEKHIENKLLSNMDYVIRDGKYMIGNAGTHRIYGHNVITSKELKSNIDYYNHYNEIMLEQSNIFVNQMQKEKVFLHKHITDHGDINNETKNTITDENGKTVEMTHQEIYDRRSELLTVMYDLVKEQNNLEAKKKNDEKDETISKKKIEKLNKEIETTKEKLAKARKDVKLYDEYEKKFRIDNNLIHLSNMVHNIVNESISNIMMGITEEYDGSNDYVKRSVGTTAPINRLKGEANNNLYTIRDKTRFAIMQDIPVSNPFYSSSINRKGATDGLVVFPLFYSTLLYNSGGKDLSSIGYGGIKTINHNHDITNGSKHFMKSSEMTMDYNYYQTNLGREVYRASLSRPVYVKIAGKIYERNLFDRFNDILTDYKESGLNNADAFERANNDLLEYMMETKNYDAEGNEKGVLYDTIVEKIIFRESIKGAVTGINHYTVNEQGEIIFPTGDALTIQEVSNDNYGMQTKKIRSNQAQKKAIMNQLLKIIGSYDRNNIYYQKIFNLLSGKITNEINKLNAFETKEDLLNYYQKKLKRSGLFEYSVKKMLYANASNNSFEEIKNDIINYMLSDIESAIKPDVSGNIYVQEPLTQYYDGTEMREMKPFRYNTIRKDENGDDYIYEYTTLEELKKDIAEGKEVSLGLQDAVMAFPHMKEFGISNKITLKEAFDYLGLDTYFTSNDYKSKDNVIVPSMEREVFNKNINAQTKIILNKEIEGNINNKTTLTEEMVDVITKRLPKSIAKIIRNDIKNKANTYKEMIEIISEYYWNLNEACNLYAIRIPTTGTSCGFPTRIVEFNNNIDNTILTSPKKSILDGSDYDIDELNVFFPAIKRDGGVSLSEKKAGDFSFNKVFFEAITGYYGDANNADDILWQTTTKDLEKAAKTVLSNEDNILHTLNHFFANQELNVSSNKLVGFQVNWGMEFGQIMSIINSISPEVRATMKWLDGIKLLQYDTLKRLFFNVNGQCVNGATDNVKLGGALSAVGVNKYTSNIVAGIAATLHKNAFYEELYKTENAITPISIEDFDAKYEIVKGGNNEPSIINANPRYAFEVIKMVCSLPYIVDFVNKCKESDSINSKTKTDMLTQIMNTNNNIHPLGKVIKDAIIHGEATFRYHNLVDDKLKREPLFISNKIRNIAHILGIAPNGIEGVDVSILEWLDSNNIDNNGDEITPNFSNVAAAYSSNATTEKKIHDYMNIRELVQNSPYLKNYIRLLIKTYQKKNELFATENMIEAIYNKLTAERQKPNIYSDLDKNVRSEVDQFYVGHLIKNASVEDTIIELSYPVYEFGKEIIINKKLNMKIPEDRRTLLSDFSIIIKQFKAEFNNQNMFLNLIKVQGAKTYNNMWGINKLKFYPEIQKKHLSQNYKDILKEAMFDEDISSYSHEQQDRINRIRGYVKALEYNNILTQGLNGTSTNITEVSTPYIYTRLLKGDTKVEDTIKEFISGIKSKDNNAIAAYKFILARSGMSKAGIRNIDDQLNINMFDEVYTMATWRGDNDNAVIMYKDEEGINRLGYPYEHRYNMYGIGENIIPVLINNKNNVLISLNGRIAREAINNAPDIILTDKDIKYNLIEKGIPDVIKINDLVNIYNRIYKLENTNGIYHLTKVEESTYADKRAYVMDILKRDGQITIQGHMLTLDEFTMMNNEEQNNLIKCL